MSTLGKVAKGKRIIAQRMTREPSSLGTRVVDQKDLLRRRFLRRYKMTYQSLSLMMKTET